MVLVCRSTRATMPRPVTALTAPSTSAAYDGSYTHDVDSQVDSVTGSRMKLAPHAFACVISSTPGASPEPSMPTRLKPRNVSVLPRASRILLPDVVSGPMTAALLPGAVVSVTSSMTCDSPARGPLMFTPAETNAVVGGAIPTAAGVCDHVPGASRTTWPIALPSFLPSLSLKYTAAATSRPIVAAPTHICEV